MKNIILILVLVVTQQSFSQLDYKFFTGAKEKEKDTVAFENARSVASKNVGIIEREVDPEKYILGPNDIFYISIVGNKSVDYETPVTPEGIIILKGAGAVSVKDMTLKEGKEAILQKLKKTFSGAEINVVLYEIKQFKVTVSGQIGKPLTVPASSSDRVSEVIEKAGGLNFDASIRKIVLMRKSSKGIEEIQVDLLKHHYLAYEDANPFLKGGDVIVIPPNNEKEIIGIYGELKAPNEFEFVKGDSLSTLIKFAQGFLATSFLDSVEVVRTYFGNDAITRKFINLKSWRDKLFSGEELEGDFPLMMGDRVYIREKREFKNYDYVVIGGEVVYPGKYAINEDVDRVSDLISWAGGFTGDASIQAIEYIRQEIEKKQDPEMDRLSRMSSSDMSKDELKYFQARIREKKGVISIDFNTVLNTPNADENIFLRHQDSIIVPKKNFFINVQGRVNNPGLVSYNPNSNYMDYILLAGGFGYRADENETILAKSKGEQFLAKEMKYVIEPGDVLLVPPKEDASFWETFVDVIQVTSQVATILGVVITVVSLSR